jgi:hypothetical protein
MSPEGRTIAFVSTRDGDPDIYMMKTEGSNLKRFGAPERTGTTRSRHLAPATGFEVLRRDGATANVATAMWWWRPRG